MAGFFLWPRTAGMPEMQEHFPAMATDGRYAGNAGAIFGDGHGRPVCRKCRSIFRRWPRTAGMPEMQEHFPAMATDGRYAWKCIAISGAALVVTGRHVNTDS